MTKLALKAQPNIVDNRVRCPTCNMLAPRHRRWCITPVVEGRAVMETRKIKGEQSLVLLDELSDEN